MDDLTSLIKLFGGGGAAGGGVVLLAFIYNSLRKGVESKTSQESCDLIHKGLDEKLIAVNKRLDKVDEIHETVIWMRAKMTNGGD